MPSFNIPTESDIQTLAANMRQSDRLDLAAVGWDDAEAAIRYSIARSREAYLTAVSVDGRLVCLFGCAEDSLLSSEGIPWMLGTELANSYIKSVTAKTRLAVRYMLHGWPVLRNVAASENRMTLRWLKSIGFTLCEPMLFEPTGRWVTPFEMRR